MALLIGDRTVTRPRCPACARTYEFVKGFAWRDGEPWAVYFAAYHGHPDHEAVIDVILGTWGDDSYDDHVTFSCRVRANGAQAVDAPVAAAGESPIFGRLLTRDEALAHERVADFWLLVDVVVEQDPDCRV